MDHKGKKIEGIKSSQEFPQQQQQREFQSKAVDYTIWANLVNFKFEKTVYFYKVKLTSVDEEKAEFTITIEKDQNLRQKVLSSFNIQQKLNDIFVGRQVYNDTLVKVIDTQPDKSFELVYMHEGENQNLEMSIELMGEKTDQKSIMNYCRDILLIFQKNVIKYQRFGKSCFFDPSTREAIRGAEHIDVITGLDLNMNIQKPNTMKINIDQKVATVFNRDVTHFLREQFQSYETVSYDQILRYLKDRRFTDGDNRLFLDDVSPKKESYAPVEVMGLHAIMYRSQRNMKFKRDPLTCKLTSLQFTVENKDVHTNDNVKMATKRKQLKDFQFHSFCNNIAKRLSEHWMFKENGIIFENNFNLINIERQLNCMIELGNGQRISTHDNDNQQDKNYNNVQKNISCKALQLQKTLKKWYIVQEAAPAMKQKVQAMVDKIQGHLSSLQGIKIENPSTLEVKDIQSFKWEEISDMEFCVFVLNSRSKKEALTKKQEIVKQQCQKNGEVPNQIILSKTFEQGDFIKMVVLNVMYDICMKLPNTIGHKVVFDQDMAKWLGGNTMVFAMDVQHKKGYKSVAAILSYQSADFTLFRSDYIVKDDEYSELKYSDDTKLKFKEIIKRCILDFEQHNQTTVHRMVFLRDGVTDPQRRFIESTEIAQINEVFAELNRESLVLWFLTASKRISTKIFEWNARDNKLNHLEAGVQISKDIVKDSLPSFQLNASNNRLSKCCQYECIQPKVVENQIDFDNLTSLCFKLSFLQFHGQNIANISVPALLKYAEKKSYFYSIIHSLKTDEAEGKDMFDIRSETTNMSMKRKRD